MQEWYFFSCYNCNNVNYINTKGRYQGHTERYQENLEQFYTPFLQQRNKTLTVYVGGQNFHMLWILTTVSCICCMGGCQDGRTVESFVILDTEHLLDNNYIWTRRLAEITMEIWHLWKNCFLSWHYKFILAKVATFFEKWKI